jgi:hypothetical protein
VVEKYRFAADSATNLPQIFDGRAARMMASSTLKRDSTLLHLLLFALVESTRGSFLASLIG